MSRPEEAEWLESDGLGGFASGTAGGVRTRRYHGSLLTAARPLTERGVLANGLEAWVETATGDRPLTTQRYAPDLLLPDDWRRITAFAPRPWPTLDLRPAGRDRAGRMRS